MAKKAAKAKIRTPTESKSSAMQLSMDTFKWKSKEWPASDKRYKAACSALVEMVCRDMHPMSIVEDEGFIRYNAGTGIDLTECE